MFRKPIFWIGFAAISVVSIVFSYHYFPRAFPIVNLDLRMDRDAALAAANALAAKYNLGPADFKQAASFGVDSEVQNFVELEAGGTEAFAAMIRDTLYAPYTWEVRHFKEGETNETSIWFTPLGKPYGFAETLPEDAPGANLTADSARSIAERTAIIEWGIHLTAYELVEKSQELRPGGRTDHTFVYERPDVKIGEGRYRLRLVVGGDRLTELIHFIKIPEAFSRKYQEMRSANDTIAFGATAAMVVVYLLGGCVIGLFFLLRQRWVLWRKPLFWGVFIAFLQFLAGLNQLPLAWMNFDTALSAEGFLLQQVAQNVGMFLLLSALLVLSFMAAESLTRKAFPHHPQMWRLWSKNVASASPILGRTIGGYLIVGIFFGYEVLLYFFSTNVLGWWTPSSALFEPDILATYFPWLNAIAISAQAGFWEECLFRAVPIAGAALLGQKYGHRNWWIAGAFVLQALVFSAAHANYPAQPAYARLVELILPSIGFGLLYLFFGLLPAIVLHFAFDVVWFAMPLFVAATPGIWFDRALVILLTLVPLIVVLIARIRAGGWGAIPDTAYNRAWTPPEKPGAAPAPGARAVVAAGMFRLTPFIVFGAGVAGLILWLLLSPFETQVPPLHTSRNQARQLAQETFSREGVQIAAPWRMLTTVDAPLNLNDRFVWQNSDPETYQSLVGTYLGPAYWNVRLAKFEGDVAERAEEFAVHIDGTGRVFRYQHKLPEARPGADLPEAAARALADSAVSAKFGLQPETLKFVSSQPQKLKARTDWTFIYADTAHYPLDQGEARIEVDLAGNEIVDVWRYIHVPEEWERQERSRRNLPNILEIGCGVMVALLVIAGAIVAIVSWSRKQFAAKTFLLFVLAYFGLSLIDIFNSWPGLEAKFMTAQPYKNQALIVSVAAVLMALILAAAISLLIGLAHHWLGDRPRRSGLHLPLALGTSLGLFATGLFALFESLGPSLSPVWPSFEAAGKYIPLLGTSLGPITGFITRAAVLLFVFAAAEKISTGWQNRKPLVAAGFILLGIIFSGAGQIDSLGSWLLSGAGTGIFLLLAYLFVVRFRMEMIPPAVAAMAILARIEEGNYQAFPAALPGAVVASALIAAVAILWAKKLGEVK